MCCFYYFSPLAVDSRINSILETLVPNGWTNDLTCSMLPVEAPFLWVPHNLGKGGSCRPLRSAQAAQGDPGLGASSWPPWKAALCGRLIFVCPRPVPLPATETRRAHPEGIRWRPSQDAQVRVPSPGARALWGTSDYALNSVVHWRLIKEVENKTWAKHPIFSLWQVTCRNGRIPAGGGRAGRPGKSRMLIAAWRGRKALPGWGARPPPFEVHFAIHTHGEGTGLPPLLGKQKLMEQLGTVGFWLTHSYLWFTLPLTCLLLASPR